MAPPIIWMAIDLWTMGTIRFSTNMPRAQPSYAWWSQYMTLMRNTPASLRISDLFTSCVISLGRRLWHFGQRSSISNHRTMARVLVGIRIPPTGFMPTLAWIGCRTCLLRLMIQMQRTAACDSYVAVILRVSCLGALTAANWKAFILTNPGLIWIS